MGQLRILTQQQVPSGNPGAVRINPNIMAPAHRANRIQAGAVADVGQSIDRATDSILEFHEKQQEAKDYTATQTGKTQLAAGMDSIIDDFKHRNDFENFHKEFERRSGELKADILKHRLLSESARHRLSLIADNSIELAKLSVDSIKRRKENLLINSEWEVAHERFIERLDFNGAKNHIIAGFNANIIDGEQKTHELANLERRILFHAVEADIQKAPEDVGAIIKSAPDLTAEDARTLRIFGNKLLETRNVQLQDDFEAASLEELTTNQYNLNDKYVEIENLVRLKVYTGKEGQQWKSRFAADVIENTSENAQRHMNTIQHRLVIDPLYTIKQAKSDLLSLPINAVTNADFSRYHKMLEGFNATQEKHSDLLAKTIFGILDDAQKNGAYTFRIVDPESDDDKLIDQETFFIRELEKEADKLRQKISGDTFTFNLKRAHLRGAELDEAKRQAIRELDDQLQIEKQKISRRINKPYNDAMEAARQWLWSNPSASKEDAEQFIQSVISQPLTSEAYKQALQ